MTHEQDDDALLKRFLVGDVAEVERQHVEHRFMTDDRFYEELRALEDEMILDYLRGTLDQAYAARLADSLSASPALRHRVEEMRSLLALVHAPERRPALAPWWRHLWTARVVVPFTAAAALALVIGNTLRWTTVPDAAGTGASATPIARAPLDVAFELTPVMRSAQADDNIFTIPAGADTVTLTFTMALETAEEPAFSLRPYEKPPFTLPTEPVVQRGGDGRAVIRWTIPATFFPAGDYLLTVTTNAGNGPRTRLTRSFAIVP